MTIGALAVGATRGIVYVRKEYPGASEAMRRASDDARAAEILGARVLDHDHAFDVEVIDGQGSYLCGEETALLNAIEGRRPEVRARPPYPTDRGLFGQPTVVNNVETLASIGWIIRKGGDAYAALGAGTSRGTKVVSLNSLFRRPGLYEVELGVPVRTIIEELGGGLASGSIQGVLIGGPLAGILPPHLFDTPFTFDDLSAVGAAVGHGGVVAFDEHTTIPELVRHVFAFGAYESCGACTPCRVGAADVERMVAEALDGSGAGPSALERWRETIAVLGATSLCGHGGGLAAFAHSVREHYAEELAACLG
jgi:formate dehydrogenase iron-sulfur subunit